MTATCDDCGSETFTSTGKGRLRTYRGEPGYEVPESLEYEACPACKAEWLSSSQIDQLSEAFELERKRRNDVQRLALWKRLKALEPRARIQDREMHPDPRYLNGPKFAITVDKGFQSPEVIGEGADPYEAMRKAIDNWNPPEPRKPSYEELETSLQTREHIDLVRKFLREFAMELLLRGETHDRSKLDRAEVDIFTAYTHKLKGTTYGSEEYKQYLKEMGVALTHHYQHNRHHPEHFAQGLEGMNLVDILEMYVDWKASVRRHANGDLGKSIEINQKRFGMSDQLTALFRNTLRDYP